MQQDKDEKGLGAPIVSLSLGLPAVFLFGTPSRKDRPQRWRLVHGDVVVWGGPSLLAAPPRIHLLRILHLLRAAPTVALESSDKTLKADCRRRLGLGGLA